jgi:hypothetical protein
MIIEGKGTEDESRGEKENHPLPSPNLNNLVINSTL